MKILTFDIEEWFHILDNDSTRTEKEWCKYEYRIHDNMERIFRILEESNISASFFVMGWIAEKFPKLIREIVDRGYEIGSHTHLHQLVYNQSIYEFKADVERSIKTLEDISGKKVKYFRAPGFSITEKNIWTFEILHELGIEIDSSVFPAQRGHGGWPSYGSSFPTILNFKGEVLKELPISICTILGKPFIYSGGGYFRVLPYEFIKVMTRRADYVMSYFHPRDMDPYQPKLEGLSIKRKFKSYVGLKRAERKFKKWINDFEFIDIRTADKLIDWDNVEIIKP